MEQGITLETVLQMAQQLSPVDKIRLVERIAPEIERELRAKAPRESLRGLWKGWDVTDADLTEIRQEMWANFPRTDI